MMDVYQTVTDRIVSMIERGAGDWRMPWHAMPAGERGAPVAMPRNVNGRTYRGVNVPLLWAAAEAFGFASPIWATYKQWQERGAQVRKGEKSTLVIFWKRIEVAANDNDDDDDPIETRLIARGYSVFNAAQVTGFEPKAIATKGELTELQRVELAERYFRNTGSIIRHGGARAYYSPTADFIQMPEFRQFMAADRYYSTMAHEHVHWTGAPHRCAREFGRRFGDNAYAFEELVAELGAAFLCAELGLSNEPRQDHAAYLAGWLRVLKGDKRAIFTAASKAQAGADFLNGLQTTTTLLAA
jgi:antirestriction protein ArdC